MSEFRVFARKNLAKSSEWDNFAQGAGCSYRCAFHAPLVLNQGLTFGFRVKRLEIILDDGVNQQKIGQCSVLIGVVYRVFSDQIQLQPASGLYWHESMKAVLIALGPGSYIYGSEWSTETPRDSDMGLIPGTQIMSSKQSYLETVEFHNWARWEDYWRAISNNARRNYRKAAESRVIQLCEAKSSSVFKLFPATFLLRRATFRRKSVRKPALETAIKSVMRAVCLLSHTVVRVAKINNDVVAFSSCINFGCATFYLEGGSSIDVDGVGWYVLLSTMKDAFDRTNGMGLFVMGPVDDKTLLRPEWAGIDRSRQQCRVARRKVTTITFNYSVQPQGTGTR